MKLLEISKILDKAEKEYLLDQKTEFIYSIAHTQEVRANYDRFEKELKSHSFLRISRYRDEKDGFTKVGRACEVTFLASDLLTHRPEIREIDRLWKLAASKSIRIPLYPFLRTNYAECKRKANLLPSIVAILEYLLKNSEISRGLYPRQIPHGESTKLIGYETLVLALFAYQLKLEHADWKSFYSFFHLKTRPNAFQFLSEDLILNALPLGDFHGLLTSENIHHWNFEKVKNCLIIENEESFFPLRSLLPSTLLILGSGKKIASAGFLQTLNQKEIYYWGDIDKEGYEILSNVLDIFPKAIPVCMDQPTIERFKHLHQSREIEKPFSRRLPHLQLEYEYVCRNGIQIEQEQIPLQQVVNIILKNFSAPEFIDENGIG